MNDELSGQLTSDWVIPNYAQSALWLVSEHESVQTEGVYGLFTLTVPTRTLILRWGAENGPALAALTWQVDSLAWDGLIRLGGYVDALHVMALPLTADPVTVIHVGGQPLKLSETGYPSAEKRQSVPYPAPNFNASLAQDVAESVSTWLIPEKNMFGDMVQQAMLRNLHLQVFGRLADDASGWDEHFALPILLNAVTLFGP